jgi:methylmalonyl-CoA mutase N-terminal domain/subunit
MTRPRIVLAKPGLDGHDRGIKVLAMGLRDAGAEVIYLGLRMTAVQITAAAAEEDAQVIGISVLSGAHLEIAQQMLAAMKAACLNIPLVVGGTITPADCAALLRLGVAYVFPTGTALPDAIAGMLRLTRSRAEAGSEDAASPEVTVGPPAAAAGGPTVTRPQGTTGPAVTTDSGIPVAQVYTAKEVAGGPESLAERLGRPGEPPFTRGPYASMYRGQLWTMRQFAGFGSPEETNERFRFLLSRGQNALSVAFDLPTQLGYDSDHQMARAEVGRVGVAIDTADDMAELFTGLPLGEISVNFTINATAPIILAMYLVAAERQQIRPSELTGTLQNDILKEFLARKAYVFPPGKSMRLVADVVEYASDMLPRFNPISVTGYHAREAGCNAVQELGLTMASAIAYCNELTGRGLRFDAFAPRLSFHFATTLDLFEEVAKLRAARRLWHDIATKRFGASDPAAARLRFFSGNSGTTLTAQEPLNNVIRSTVQCLGAVLGGAQSIHVMGYDEAFEIPSEEAVTLSLRTQQIIALETGIARTADPLAGSYFVEHLTDEIEARARSVVQDIEDSGGAVRALETGLPQRWVTDAAYQAERDLDSGKRPKVGVNVYASEDNREAGRNMELFQPAPGIAERQIGRLRRRKAARDQDACDAALRRLEQDTAGGRNVMPSLIDAARSGATVGEMSDVFRQAFGEFREPSPW